eukprot:gene16686-11942_t
MFELQNALNGLALTESLMASPRIMRDRSSSEPVAPGFVAGFGSSSSSSNLANRQRAFSAAGVPPISISRPERVRGTSGEQARTSRSASFVELLSISIPPNSQYRSNSDDSDSPSTRGCDTTESYQSSNFSRPNSSRAAAPSPFDQYVLSHFSNMSMKSPHGFQATAAQVASLPQTVVPVARAPRQQSMKRISEANERDTSSREGSPGPEAMIADEYDHVASIPLVPSSSLNRGSVLEPISEAQTSQDDYDIGYVRGTASSTSVGGLLETAMPNSSGGFPGAFPMARAEGGAMSQVGSFPTMSPAESRTEHVTFSDKNQTVLLSPHRNAALERPDPLGRQPLRRSVTEPLNGRYPDRGDVTPGAVMSFSQPVAAADHHYATPQNKTKQDFDAFLKTSQGASKHVVDNLLRIYHETIAALTKWQEREKANKNCSVNVSALGLEGQNVVSAIIDSMPTCMPMPIPMQRSHSMPVFTGDISSTHASSHGSGIFSMASHPSAMGSERLSYQGAYRNHQMQSGEVSLFHSGSGSGGSGSDHFQLRCVASSPPKL